MMHRRHALWTLLSAGLAGCVASLPGLSRAQDGEDAPWQLLVLEARPMRVVVTARGRREVFEHDARQRWSSHSLSPLRGRVEVTTEDAEGARRSHVILRAEEVRSVQLTRSTLSVIRRPPGVVLTAARVAPTRIVYRLRWVGRAPFVVGQEVASQAASVAFLGSSGEWQSIYGGCGNHELIPPVRGIVQERGGAQVQREHIDTPLRLTVRVREELGEDTWELSAPVPSWVSPL